MDRLLAGRAVPMLFSLLRATRLIPAVATAIITHLPTFPNVGSSLE